VRLSPELILNAYSQGYFPMAEGRKIYWLDPDPRAIFELATLTFSRRLLRHIRQGNFQVSYNQACPEVIRACAQRPDTWLSPEIQKTYIQLHSLGFVQSVEVWQGQVLAGGLYGVALGGLFAGESMFHRVSEASKIAFYYLVLRLRAQGYSLLDAQLLNDHTASLGAIEIPRPQYHQRLTQALSQECYFDP